MLWLLDIISLRKSGVFPAIIRGILYIISIVYRVFVSVYHSLYDSGLLRAKGLSVPIISVGNITTGGTGKTPMVEFLARRFSTGRKTAVLSRGYGRRSKGIQIVSDGGNVLLSPPQAGEEPFLLAERLPQIAVVVGSNRVRAGQRAVGKLGAELLILDDGYQHRSIKRDLNIVMINARIPFGHGYLLPRGLLREPRANLKRADIFILTRVDELAQEGLALIKSQLHSVNPQAPVVESEYCPSRLKMHGSPKCYPLSMIKGKDIAALSSIVDVESFERTLVQLGANVRRTFHYPDHYWYKEGDIKVICSGSGQVGAGLIITTEKDAARFPATKKCPLPVFALVIELKLGAGGEKFEEYLKKI